MRFVFFAWGFIAFPFVICWLFIIASLVQTWCDIYEEKERRRTQEKLEFIRAINRKAQTAIAEIFCAALAAKS